MPKSACPGVSIKLTVHGPHDTGMLAAWIVIPRSRSAGRKSVVVDPVSTVPGVDRYPERARMDSVSVVLPESVGQHGLGMYIFVEDQSSFLTDVCNQCKISDEFRFGCSRISGSIRRVSCPYELGIHSALAEGLNCFQGLIISIASP